MDMIMVILHVVTAVFIIGPMAILPMTGMRAIKAGEGGQVAVLAKSTLIFSLLSLLVVIFGFGIIGIRGISMTVPWILLSIVFYAIALILTLTVVVPALRRASRRLAPAAPTAPGKPRTPPQGTPSNPATGAGPATSAASATGSTPATLTAASVTDKNEYTLVAMGSGISSILLLITVVLMVWKP